MRSLTLFLPVGLLLAACDGGQELRESLYRTGAEVGNRYCTTRDDALRDSAVARINRGLRGEGALFDFRGIDCDSTASETPLPDKTEDLSAEG